MESRTKKLIHQKIRGFALVLVLCIIALLAVLITAFFSNITTELTSTQSAASSDSARRLAESTVQMVAAQVMTATKSQDASGNRIAWASQPGMIRSYAEDGTPSTFYKLYSSPNTTMAGNAFSVAAELPPNNWDTKSGVYTDLNSPVITNTGGSTLLNFPIVDPRAKTTSGSTSVEGFDYAASVSGVVLPTGTPDNQRLAMPALWLYQLQDGTFIVPDVTNSSASTVAFPAGSAPTAQNPIVGRVAYWTDDETSKVNINTASEGIYYDIPRYMGPPEFVLSMYPPVVGEYQRYPGHPATTCLSAVLGAWLPSPNDLLPGYDTTSSPPGMTEPSPKLNAATTSKMQQRLTSYLNLTPRFRFGGSQGGTIITSVDSTGTVPPLASKTDRLYSSVDELLYAPDRNGSGLDKDILNKTRFFLTANNRAPEVNLFGKPKITIWPISSNPSGRTLQDKLIAFCSTIGTPPNQYPFYFQRSNPKSNTFDYSGIARNPQLYSYLQTLTSDPIPGFGGSFTDKYGAGERNQILTEIFDYIRFCNLNDPNLPTSATYTDSAAAPGYYSPIDPPYASPGLVVPITIGSTKGAGRYPTIDQAFLVFYTPEDPKPNGVPALVETKIRAALYFNLIYPTQGYMPAYTNAQFEVDATGSTFECQPVSNPDPTKTAALVTGGDGLFNFFLGGSKVIQWANENERNNGQGNPRNWGGNHSYGAFARHTISDSNVRKKFTLVSAGIPVVRGDPANAKWNLKGGEFKVRLLSGAGDEIQTYEFSFPNSDNLPLPTGIAVNTTSYPAPPVYANKAKDIESNGLANAIALISTDTPDPNDSGKTIPGGVIVRALQLADKTSAGDYIGGDFRRLAYMKNVPKEWFVKHKDYDAGVRTAHSLRDGLGYPLPGSTNSGKLFTSSNIFSPDSSNPFVRSEITAVYASKTGVASDAPGDWNNAFGYIPEGAYLNRPDEGTAYAPTGGGQPYFSYDGKGQNKNLTSPNKQLPSAGMFGSLPTGTTQGISWQTLLFRPDYSGKHAGRAGFKVDGTALSKAPADYLWLDFFHMPVVEPYAISEPFSTAGKINMNCQILPYSYITRETGIRAVLKSERILAISSPSTTSQFKYYYSRLSNPDYRLPLNLDETLKGFRDKFTSGDLFRSASEICSLDMVPKDTGASYGSTSMKAYWDAHQYSGDNVRERVYATTYPRLTTKSNTYTVHFRVQTLKKVPGTAANTFVVGKDVATSEYRGSSTMERYVDAADPNLPDFATNTTANLDAYYKFRILKTNRFMP